MSDRDKTGVDCLVEYERQQERQQKLDEVLALISETARYLGCQGYTSRTLTDALGDLRAKVEALR